jgi:nucleoside-diphosphate-sugar epimerase
MIDGQYRLMMSDLNDPVNLGNPNEMSVLSLAELIIDITGSKSIIKFESLPENDPKVRRPNINRALNNLAWKPKVSIEEGLKNTIEYFEKKISETA